MKKTTKTKEVKNSTKKKPSTKATKRTRVIRRRKKSSTSKLYFNDDTQKALEEHQNSTDRKEREIIYEKRILPAFEKLVENLINIHKFSSVHDSYDDLKHDCVTFLYETIGKFDVNRGTKAFSYFNVVAKNWLIIRTKQRKLKSRRSISIDNPELLSSIEEKIIDEYCVIDSQDSIIERRDMAESIIENLYTIRGIVKNENELACVNAIITIFENIDELDLLNKSAILLYIREMTGMTQKQLTTAMQIVKKYYSVLKTGDQITVVAELPEIIKKSKKKN